MNILFVIVDCLRFDRVTPRYMPWLHDWGRAHTVFKNCWSTSHCTDPSITHMLSGKHPDELKLYSMMYGDKKYNIPEDVVMLPEIAVENGFSTGMITNVGRWYKRGVQNFVDCRGWPGTKIFQEARAMVNEAPEPWFITVHTDDCHAKYTGGSYDAACEAVDSYIKGLLYHVDEDDTMVLITADHGEGLGQSGPDGKVIAQHGYGLWDFLTHIPLVVHIPRSDKHKRICTALAGNCSIHTLMEEAIKGKIPSYTPPFNIFQAGATPSVFHRGVVMPNGNQFVRATYKNGTHEKFWIGDGIGDDESVLMEELLARHCKAHGIEYGETIADQIVIDRLKGLGYFE